jgi:hypothetical protein
VTPTGRFWVIPKGLEALDGVIAGLQTPEISETNL